MHSSPLLILATHKKEVYHHLRILAWGGGGEGKVHHSSFSIHLALLPKHSYIRAREAIGTSLTQDNDDLLTKKARSLLPHEPAQTPLAQTSSSKIQHVLGKGFEFRNGNTGLRELHLLPTRSWHRFPQTRLEASKIRLKCITSAVRGT